MAGPDVTLLSDADQTLLYSQPFTVARLADRMGLRLAHPALHPRSDGKMNSAAVFPGTVQCPPDGQPIIMLCDAQTTGGYPRIAHIARCDRHMLGQVRPGDRVQFLRRTVDQLSHDLTQKTALFESWLPGFSFT